MLGAGECGDGAGHLTACSWGVPWQEVPLCGSGAAGAQPRLPRGCCRSPRARRQVLPPGTKQVLPAFWQPIPGNPSLLLRALEVLQVIILWSGLPAQQPSAMAEDDLGRRRVEYDDGGQILLLHGSGRQPTAAPQRESPDL